MNVKDLSQLHRLNQEICDIQAKISELKSVSEGAGCKITGLPHANKLSDKVGKLSIELEYYKDSLNNRLERCNIELIRLNNYISNCEDSFTRQVLTYRFVNGLTWGQVAAHIGCTSTESVKKAAYRYIDRN